MFRTVTSIIFVLQLCLLTPVKAEEDAQHTAQQNESLIITVARALHLRSKYISYPEPLHADRPQLFTSIEKLNDVGTDGWRGGDTRFLIGLEWRSDLLQ